MNPNSDNFNRPEALLKARRSERRYAEQGRFAKPGILVTILILFLTFN
jgi:hypothetical protein